MPRPFPWEAQYAPGVRWDAPIRRITLPALLDEAVARFADLPAIEFRGRRLSYAALRDRVDRFAAGLTVLGLARGDRVALLLPNTPWHPVAFFGALRAGLTLVHLSPLDAPRMLAHKLADSGARAVVSTDLPGVWPAALRLLREAHVAQVVWAPDAAWGPNPDALGPAAEATRLPEASVSEWPALDPDDVALLQYTGGTTGLPRAAMLTHANLTAAVAISEASSAGDPQPLGPGDRVIGVLPLFHIYALTLVLTRPLSRGAEILLRTRFDAGAVLDDIERGRATVLSGVPTMWIALASAPGVERRDLSSLRRAFAGGAPLPAEIAVRLQRLTGLKLSGGWGMTETSPVGTRIPAGVTYRPGMIGIPGPGIEMDVVALDDPRRVLAPGEVGEIRIRGPNVTRGYWNRPEETARAFVDGFLLTGDVGFMEPDGTFFLVDRKKDMIISGGFNVYPRIIEDAIYEHPDVAECAAVGMADAYRGEAAKAFVVLRPGAAPLTLDVLREFLRERLGRHEMPVALEIRDSLPRTPVGKLSRKELADEERNRSASR